MQSCLVCVFYLPHQWCIAELCCRFLFLSPIFHCKCADYLLCGRPLRTLEPLNKGPVWVHRQQWLLLLLQGKKALCGVLYTFFCREKGKGGELLACCVQLTSCFQLYEWCLACVFSRVNVEGCLLVFFYTQSLSRGGRPVIVQNDHAGAALPPSKCALGAAGACAARAFAELVHYLFQSDLSGMQFRKTVITSTIVLLRVGHTLNRRLSCTAWSLSRCSRPADRPPLLQLPEIGRKTAGLRCNKQCGGSEHRVFCYVGAANKQKTFI